MRTATVEIRGELLELLPEKAVWWAGRHALVLSDTHFGKVTHFRRNGLYVPSSAKLETIKRLEWLIVKYQPETVFVLGDLFHSASNEETQDVMDLLARHPEIRFVVVIGNHDRHHEPLLEKLGWESVYEWEEGPFTFVHEPQSIDGRYVLAGHIHPAVRLQGKGRQRLKRPCFHFGDMLGVLPAFGEFTGTYVIEPQKSDTIGVCLEDEIWLISSESPLDDGLG
ncbi:ligase-associated DNA damage response endonuclease PdeM [Cryomorphaceae bacterium]|nr:ligase-associated DNA damage response endonuclease PdeM [Cryomorphaceae bacterium]